MQSASTLPAIVSKRENLNHAIQIWQAGVARVKGEQATRTALEKSALSPFPYILAIGKAASSMMSGAIDYLTQEGKALVVTKYHYTEQLIANDSRIKVIESSHPVPDQNSLNAGKAMIQFIQKIPADKELLFLVSGGASALAEYPIDSISLDQLQNISKALLADGYSIDQINAIRIRTSKIKGGKLLKHFKGSSVYVFGLSDIPGNDANLIGSGIAAIEPPKVREFKIPDQIEKLLTPISETQQPSFNYQSHLVGSNQVARIGAMEKAIQSGLEVIEQTENIKGDILELAETLAKKLKIGKQGVYIWGGESTVLLPKNPGQGGRNQSLTLALALALERMGAKGIDAVIAGTDGNDGMTDAAGGLLWPGIDLSSAQEALNSANATPWLKKSGGLFKTNPTGTNVMDLMIVIKSDANK